MTEDNIFDVLSEDKLPYRIEENVEATTHQVYILSDIVEDCAKYAELLRFLSVRHEFETIIVHLASGGGDCHSGVAIMHALKNCAANVIISVVSPCYSMGAMIALCGDGLILQPKTFLMFHNFSTEQSGKAGELKTGLEHYSRHFFGMLEYGCCPFLTDKEVGMLKRDVDVYVHESDKTLESRIERHFNLGDDEDDK